MPYIVECFESIREQSFGDFELLICDNASTDGTEEVSRELARADSRVRYLRVDSDSGASANFNHCFVGTKGALFTWVASDDRFLPRYLERTVDHLREHAEDAMCVPAVRFIDEDGIVSGMLSQPVSLSSPRVDQRLKSYLDRRSWFMVYGLARREALEQTALFPQRFGPDVILVWEMLLRFRIGTIPETLLDYRRYRVKEAQAVWRGLQPEGEGRVPRWLHLGLFKDLLESCDRDGVDPAARVAGRRALVRWLASLSFRDLVVDDLRDELRRPGRARNPLYDAALLASMTLLRPGRALRNARRQPMMQILGQAGDRTRSSAP
jgi:glycosyltransferase involved in cell wall biosynthesis